MNKLSRITDWECCGHRMATQWGLLTYLEWCKKEAARQVAKGRACVIRFKEYDKVTVCCITRA